MILSLLLIRTINGRSPTRQPKHHFLAHLKRPTGHKHHQVQLLALCLGKHAVLVFLVGGHRVRPDLSGLFECFEVEGSEVGGEVSLAFVHSAQAVAAKAEFRVVVLRAHFEREVEVTS